MENSLNNAPFWETGKRLKEFRLALPSRCTQAMLSDALGITQGTYSLYECGERPISKPIKALLEGKYSLNVVWLETGRGSMFLEEISATMNNLFSKLNEENQKYILETIKRTYVAQTHSKELDIL